MALYSYPDGTVTALPPPDGYIVDFENPQRQFVDALNWTSGALGVVTLLFVCQRLYVRLFLEKGLFLDDGCLLVAWVILLAMTAIIIHTTVLGALGTHAWELTFDAFATYFRQGYSLPILYTLCSLFAKMALLIYYFRFMQRPWHRLVIFFVMFFVLGSSLGLTLATIFSCQPIARAWDVTINDYQCIDLSAISKASGITGLITDIALLIIPATMIMHLRIHWKQRVSLATMFLIGVVTIVVAAVLLYVDIDQQNQVDITWASAPKLYWLIIEANLLVICATFPSLAQFFRHIAPKHMGELPAIQVVDRPDNDRAFLMFGGFGEKNQKAKNAQYSRFVSTEYALDSFSQIDSERTVSRGSTNNKATGDIDWHVNPIGQEATASREDIIQHLRGAYK
ncbi:hypothetical protein F5X99DRAFT_370837 [Biscogniauxia marginata]|nr:hypothetical protein F5X99DRAFT_370837 [Biscogniauxia marginata]